MTTTDTVPVEADTTKPVGPSPRHTGGATLAAALRRLANRVEMVGDIAETLLQVSFQVGAQDAAACETVNRLTAATGNGGKPWVSSRHSIWIYQDFGTNPNGCWLDVYTTAAPATDAETEQDAQALLAASDAVPVVEATVVQLPGGGVAARFNPKEIAALPTDRGRTHGCTGPDCTHGEADQDALDADELLTEADQIPEHSNVDGICLLDGCDETRESGRLFCPEHVLSADSHYQVLGELRDCHVDLADAIDHVDTESSFPVVVSTRAGFR